jgi:hypothetical protein
MPDEAQTWRELNQMLQGLMQEAQGQGFTGALPADVPPHPEAGVLRERPPPEWAPPYFSRPVAALTDGYGRRTLDLPFAHPRVSRHTLPG